ncbi:MAG: hypothetical protein KGN84_13270 [Acidobacteriota bacterium]|nr:hypothetical protein [Acidobacteriota bacterium]
MKRLFAIPIAIATVAGVLFIEHYRTGEFFEPARLLARFPAENGSALSIDVKGLRDAGLLTVGKSPLEPDYKQFLDGTGLDYHRDLDLVVAQFSRSGNYFLARGRFDWKKLREYAVRHGGSCYQELCRMPGSRPERRISFLPLRDDTIGLAVSADDLAASKLLHVGPLVTSPIPTEPVWFSVPGAVLQEPNALPQGMRFVLSALTRADRVVVTAGPYGAAIEARLSATCRNADDARTLASQLRATTASLREAIDADKDASQDHLARMLAAGAFDASGSRVTGKWPVDKRLIESLTDGI